MCVGVRVMIYLRHKRVNLLCGPKNMGKGCMSMVLVHTTFDQVYLDSIVVGTREIESRE